MIIVNGRLELTDTHIDALKPALAAMEQASRGENGCFDYTFSIEVNEPSTIRITERWESMDALRVHFASTQMGEFQAALSEHPPSNAEVHFYEVERELPRP